MASFSITINPLEGKEACDYVIEKCKQVITEENPDDNILNKCKQILGLTYNTLSHIYTRIHHDGILPDSPGEWHDDYKQALINAAKYGDKESQEICKAAALN